MLRITLNKAVGDLPDTAVKTVCGVQRTLPALTEDRTEICGQRQFRTAETVNSLPVITDSKQCGLRVLGPQGVDQFCPQR